MSHFGHRWGSEHVVGTGRVHYCIPEDVFLLHDAAGNVVGEVDGEDAAALAQALLGMQGVRDSKLAQP